MAKSKKEADRDAAVRRIANELSTIGYALPGTLTVRAYACGKANCRCKSDPAARHGPYAYWTRKVGSTTKTRALTQAQLEDSRQWLDNARRLKELVAELYELRPPWSRPPRWMRMVRARPSSAHNGASEPVTQTDARTFPAPRTVCFEHACQRRSLGWSSGHLRNGQRRWS